MFYLISPAVFVAVLSQTEWSTWPPQHTTSWHQRNKAQTELVTCFGVFSPPSVQISTLGRDPTLLLLCPVHSVSLPHSLLQFHIICLTPTHLSHLSHLLFRSSPSVSLSPPLTDSISCGFFTGHLSHSVYGSHGFASASQGKKNSGFWEFSLISWYQCAPLSQSPPPAPLSFSSHVNWTSGGEVTAPPLCDSLTKLEAAREIRFDELWKKKEEGRVRRGCGLLFVL